MRAIARFGCRMSARLHSFAPTSSGDLLLDRRYRWAVESLRGGDAAAARDILDSVVEAAPHWPPGWFALAEACEAAGNRPAAISAFEKSLACDGDDALGARLRLARLRGDSHRSAEGAGYVRALFDCYAPTFDAHLRKGLNYRGPEALYAAATRVLADRGRALDFALGLDLGCGTGLAGRAFRGVCRQLVGVDLSAGMVAEARRAGVYDSLAVGDVAEFLAQRRQDEADLALAADVFVYIGPLEPTFKAVRRVLAPEGLFALTLQRVDEDASLGDDLRYSHSCACVERAAVGAGFVVALLEPTSTRRERGEDAPGWVVVLTRS
jgi:predicted TPR repeat methyltransferase